MRAPLLAPAAPTSGLSLAERLAARGLTGTVEALARAHNVTTSDILGRGRTKAVAAARHAVMRALRERGLSLPEIGYLLGRDHTTVLHAVSDERRSRNKLASAMRYERARVLGPEFARDIGTTLAEAVRRGVADGLRRTG